MFNYERMAMNYELSTCYAFFSRHTAIYLQYVRNRLNKDNNSVGTQFNWDKNVTFAEK